MNGKSSIAEDNEMNPSLTNLHPLVSHFKSLYFGLLQEPASYAQPPAVWADVQPGDLTGLAVLLTGLPDTDHTSKHSWNVEFQLIIYTRVRLDSPATFSIKIFLFSWL